MIENQYLKAELICDESSYGLVFKNSDGEAVKIIKDIYTDRYTASEIVRKCNIRGVSEAHIFDIIEDSLM